MSMRDAKSIRPLLEEVKNKNYLYSNIKSGLENIKEAKYKVSKS